MIEEKFSPGPWTFTLSKSGDALLNSPGRRCPWSAFATVIIRMEGDNVDYPEGVANLNLMLAAPEMYEFIKNLPNGDLSDVRVAEQDRILAKALGNGPESIRMRALSKLTDEERKAMIGYTGL